MRRRITIRGCVRPPVRRSVTPSLRRVPGASYAVYLALFFLWSTYEWCFSFSTDITRFKQLRGFGKAILHAWFLDASSHLYKRVCPSVNPTSKIPLIHLQSLTNHPWSFLDASSHLLSCAILVSLDIAPIPPTSWFQVSINQIFCILLQKLIKAVLLLSI